MFALIWVILLFADKVAGSETMSQKSGSDALKEAGEESQSVSEGIMSTSFSVSTTTLETKTFNSTISVVPVEHSHNNTAERVSSNSSGAVNLSPATHSKDPFKELLMTIQEPKVLFAALTGFVIGIILSAIILCVVTKCCRKKRKTSENLSENLEMVTTEAVPMMEADAAVYDGIQEPDAAEGEEAQHAADDGDLAPKEVEYSNINFSAIQTRNPEEAVKTQETTETEYAEIKREAKRRENGQEDSETLEGNEETEEDNGAIKAEEEGDADVALYSSVEEIMG